MHTLIANIYLNKNNNFIENEMNIGIADISPIQRMHANKFVKWQFP